MKNLLTILLILLPLSAHAWGVVVTSGGVAGGCGENCEDFLICQNFEGTGYDNSETWTENGTVDEDYTTTALRGSQSCKITTTGYIQSPVFTATSSLTLHWMYRKSANPASEAILFSVSGGGYMAFGHLEADGTVKVSTGNGSVVYTSALDNDTTYHMWLVYTAGSTGNGSAALYVGTGTTRPTSAGATAVNAALTNNVEAFRIYVGGVTSPVDHILASGTDFSEVCE